MLGTRRLGPSPRVAWGPFNALASSSTSSSLYRTVFPASKCRCSARRRCSSRKSARPFLLRKGGHEVLARVDIESERLTGGVRQVPGLDPRVLEHEVLREDGKRKPHERREALATRGHALTLVPEIEVEIHSSMVDESVGATVTAQRNRDTGTASPRRIRTG